MTDVLQPKMAGSGGKEELEVDFKNGQSLPWTEKGAR